MRWRGFERPASLRQDVKDPLKKCVNMAEGKAYDVQEALFIGDK